MDIFETIKEMISTIFTFIRGSLNALKQMKEQIDSFNDVLNGYIINMSEGQSVAGLPVTEAIGTIRYIVGDTLFYMMYLVILFGVLFTIFKISTLMINKLSELIDKFKFLGGKQGIIDAITGMFRGR